MCWLLSYLYIRPRKLLFQTFSVIADVHVIIETEKRYVNMMKHLRNTVSKISERSHRRCEWGQRRRDGWRWRRTPARRTCWTFRQRPRSRTDGRAGRRTAVGGNGKMDGRTAMPLCHLGPRFPRTDQGSWWETPQNPAATAPYSEMNGSGRSGSTITGFLAEHCVGNGANMDATGGTAGWTVRAERVLLEWCPAP